MSKIPLLSKNFIGNLAKSEYYSSLIKNNNLSGPHSVANLAKKFSDGCAKMNYNTEQPQTNHKEADKKNDANALKISQMLLGGKTTQAVSSQIKSPTFSKPSPQILTEKLKPLLIPNSKPSIPPKPNLQTLPKGIVLQGKLLPTQKPSPMAIMGQNFSTLIQNPPSAPTPTPTPIPISTDQKAILSLATQSKSSINFNLDILLGSAFNTPSTNSIEQNTTSNKQQAENVKIQKSPVFTNENNVSLFNRQMTDKEKKAGKLIFKTIKKSIYENQYKHQYEKMKEGKSNNDVGVFTLKMNYPTESLKIHFHEKKAIGYQSSNDKLPDITENGASKNLTHRGDNFVSLELKHNLNSSDALKTINNNNQSYFKDLTSFKPTYFIDEKHAIARNGGVSLYDYIDNVSSVKETNSSQMLPHVPLSAFKNAMKDLKELHKKEIYFIDIKPENMAIDRNKISFIDTDDVIDAKTSITNITNSYSTRSLLINDQIDNKQLTKTNIDAFASLLTIIETTENELFDEQGEDGLRSYGLISEREGDDISELERATAWIDKNIKPEHKADIILLATNPAYLTKGIELYDAIDWDNIN